MGILRKLITQLYFVEALCSPCLVTVLIHRTCFVTSVVNSPQSRIENPLPVQCRRRMNYILAVKLVARTRAGHHICVAVDVRDIYVAG
jgi:hypothetical protein